MFVCSGDINHCSNRYIRIFSVQPSDFPQFPSFGVAVIEEDSSPIVRIYPYKKDGDRTDTIAGTSFVNLQTCIHRCVFRYQQFTIQINIVCNHAIQTRKFRIF